MHKCVRKQVHSLFPLIIRLDGCPTRPGRDYTYHPKESISSYNIRLFKCQFVNRMKASPKECQPSLGSPHSSIHFTWHSYVATEGRELYPLYYVHYITLGAVFLTPVRTHQWVCYQIFAILSTNLIFQTAILTWVFHNRLLLNSHRLPRLWLVWGGLKHPPEINELFFI